MDELNWADRGLRVDVDVADGNAGACVGISGMGSVQLPTGLITAWLQLRGSAWVEAREGTFQLHRGDWIVLERGSRPLLQADRHGLCIGVCIAGPSITASGEDAHHLYPWRGTMSKRDLRTALRLWRQLAQGLRLDPANGSGLTPLLRHLSGMQLGVAEQLERCPGRSQMRKRHVLCRLQRARLYLEGHCDRVVRIAELANLTSLSYWYFSKAFHALYGESPQAAGARLRLERAATLLEDTPLVIGEVAAASGFESNCSFARAFRSHFGVSATEYRQKAAAVKANSAYINRASRNAEMPCAP